MAEGMRLSADSLLSKWGFNDGEVPDGLLDWCDARDMPYPEDWHATLVYLVRTYLVPVLDKQIELVEIRTSHNPIREATGDAAEWWEVEPVSAWDAPEPQVVVPYEVVMAAAVEGSGRAR